MTLKDWLESRWLTAHQVSPEEIADLLAVVDRDLVDAAVDGLSAESTDVWLDEVTMQHTDDQGRVVR